MIMPTDCREQALFDWVRQTLATPFDWSVVSADASRRRYFRAGFGSGETPQSVIAVDAPPEYEDVAAFMRVAGLMRGAGLHVPVVHAVDDERGFLLLSDLGDTRYIDVLDEHNADALFGAAIGSLLDWQAASRPAVLPDYDRATFVREIRLFHEWFLPHRLGHEPDAAMHAALERAYDFIIDRVLAQPPVFVHRDFMPRNLMLAEPQPGVIDFQDARYGPATYDVASLFRDAFISWPAARIDEWTRRYWDEARCRGLPVAADWSCFVDDLALTGAQRHLKIMGLFVRIAERDGKPAYAADLARFAGYLQPVVDGFEALAPLRAPIAEALDGTVHRS